MKKDDSEFIFKIIFLAFKVIKEWLPSFYHKNAISDFLSNDDSIFWLVLRHFIWRDFKIWEHTFTGHGYTRTLHPFNFDLLVPMLIEAAYTAISQIWGETQNNLDKTSLFPVWNIFLEIFYFQDGGNCFFVPSKCSNTLILHSPKFQIMLKKWNFFQVFAKFLSQVWTKFAENFFFLTSIRQFLGVNVNLKNII